MTRHIHSGVHQSPFRGCDTENWVRPFAKLIASAINNASNSAVDIYIRRECPVRVPPSYELYHTWSAEERMEKSYATYLDKVERWVVRERQKLTAYGADYIIERAIPLHFPAPRAGYGAEQYMVDLLTDIRRSGYYVCQAGHLQLDIAGDEIVD